MNKRIYSLIWNRSLNQIVVASELASGKRGASASSSTGNTAPARHRLLAMSLLLVCLAPLPVRVLADTSCGGANQSAGTNAVTCGFGSRAGYAATAAGFDSYAAGNYSTAIGRDSYAGNSNAVALGSYANAKSIDATALGSAS